MNNSVENASKTDADIADNLVTSVFNDGFVPSAKITNKGSYNIISDYLGTPVEAYDEQGQRVWSAELDVYGRVKEFTGDLKESRFNGHMDKHGMNHDVIKDTLDNPDNIFYHKNNNHLLFYKDGDVVVVSGKDSGIITAYGKSDAAGVYKDIKSITDKPAITQIE